jgi:hypothetical protein
MDIPGVQGVQVMNEASQVPSLNSDFFLVGWQGNIKENAPLVCVSAGQIRDYIHSITGTSPEAVNALSEPTVAMSIEEFMDEMHGQFKDCFVQYSINDEGELSVNVERNIEASSLGSTITEVSINRTKYYRIDTNILLKDIAEETVQVSQIVSLEDVGQAFIQTTTKNCIFIWGTFQIFYKPLRERMLLSPLKSPFPRNLFSVHILHNLRFNPTTSIYTFRFIFIEPKTNHLWVT